MAPLYPLLFTIYFRLMFACLFEIGSSSNAVNKEAQSVERFVSVALLDLAYCFSPFIEESADNTLVLDLNGYELLFDSYRDIAAGIAARAAHAELKLNIAIANDPDTAILVARHIGGIVFVAPGEEEAQLTDLPTVVLDPALVKINSAKAIEIIETLSLWGINNCGQFAVLPEIGVIERLGQDGLRLQRLAKGTNNRALVPRKLKPKFEYSIQLEHHLKELEPLSFVLARLLNELCASLDAVALATNELYLYLKLEKEKEYTKTLNLPSPTRESRTFIKLLLLALETDPPEEPITEVHIGCNPTRPRVTQYGLFQPLAPEPDKLEMTLARIGNLVGKGNIGAAELLDTHRPDAFSVRHFAVRSRRKGSKKRLINKQPLIGFRRFRPLLQAEVQTLNGRPLRITAHDSLRKLSGRIVNLAGPWRTTGDWWSGDNWSRDEWDVSIKDSSGSETLYRIFHERSSDKWYVEGVYD